MIYLIIYIVGCIVSFLFFNSMSINIKQKQIQQNISPVLFYLTFICFILSSWTGTILYLLLGILDNRLKVNVLFPINFSIKPEL